MPRFLFAADVHVGNHVRHGGALAYGINQRARDVLDVLTRFIELAVRQRATPVIVGDLIDTWRPTPGLLRSVAEILQRSPSAIILSGNHEWGSATDHALRPLWQIAKIIEEPGFIAVDKRPVMFAWPFYSARPSFREWKKTFTDPLVKRLTFPIFTAHVGFAYDALPPWLASDGIPHEDDLFELMEAFGTKLAVLGDYHHHVRRERDDMTIVQCGALAPTGFGNPGFEHGMVLLVDVNGTKVSTELHQIEGPRFLKLDTSDLKRIPSFDDERWTVLYVETPSPEVALAVKKLEGKGRRVVVELLEGKETLVVTDQQAPVDQLEAVVREWCAEVKHPEVADEIIERLQRAKMPSR